MTSHVVQIAQPLPGRICPVRAQNNTSFNTNITSMEELLFVYSRGAGLNLVKDFQIIHIKVLTGDHGQKI